MKMSEEYTLEKTIAFFSIGHEHYVDQDLARYVASELTRMSAEIQRRNEHCQDCPTFIEQDGIIDRLTDEIQQKEAKRRALWDALVSAYKREGCGLGEAQILADVVMDSASDKQATDPKRDPLGEFDRRERSGSSVSDRRDDSWWCDSCQETHHDGQTCSAADRQSGRFTRDNQDDLYLDGKRIGKLIGAPFNVLETLNAITVATKQCICGDEHLRNGWVKEHCPVHGAAESGQSQMTGKCRACDFPLYLSGQEYCTEHQP